MQQHSSRKTSVSLILTITLILLIIPFSLAEIVPVNTNNQALITNEQLNNQIQQQGLQTRSEITTYIDQKVAETISTLTTDGQEFINKNFKAFDKQMHELALKVLIQLIVGIMVAIILANAIWYAIKKAIDKKGEERPRYLILDTLTAKNYGLISEEYKAKIDREKNTNVKPPVFEETKNNPEPPTLTEIEQMINQAEDLKNPKKTITGVNKPTEPKKGFIQKIKEKNEQKKKDKNLKKKMLEQKKAKEELEKIEEIEKKEKEKIEKKKSELKKKLEKTDSEEGMINIKDLKMM